MTFATLPSSLPFVKTGKLKALATASSHRSPTLPEIPTIAEAALPGFDASNWMGMFAPGKTPPRIVDFIQRRARDTGIVRVHAMAALTKGLKGEEMTEIGLLKAQIKDGLSQYLYERTKRRPLVFPVVLMLLNSGGLKASTLLPGFPTDSFLAFALAVPFIQGALFSTMNAVKCSPSTFAKTM